MYLSKFQLTTLKETPSDAEITSHQLMLRAGLIRKLASGLYTWLPLGLRVMRKVNNCAMCFDAGSPHLARYLAAAEEKAETLDEPPKRLDFGPDMMTPLHRDEPFPLHPDIAMFSRPVLHALANDGGKALRVHQAAWGGVPKAANLCGSIDTRQGVLTAAIRRLQSDEGARAKRGPDDDYIEIAAEKGAPIAW